ncbi:MAG: YggS family pyridoxal phosphate-dependent enzyme [Dehalococcoidia bacterium]|nr:YggS family pyridoxal phosphate-dependent enzyme [Dehalococcoidia bacterium]
MSDIADRVAHILSEVPDYVQVVAAAKSRTPDDVMAVVHAGIGVIGENYVRDARTAQSLVGSQARWHFIGRLREHDVRASTLTLFDMIQSVDSLSLAQRISEKCGTLGRSMDVLIEVNSGREKQKGGVLPEQVETLVRHVSALSGLRICGLMTMGPLGSSPNDYRPFFAETARLFKELQQLQIPGATMDYLSMGTSDSYSVAIEEGATMVRIGSALFGPR